MRTVKAGNIYNLSNMIVPPARSYKTDARYSNATQFCFFNKACQEKRDAANALAASELNQQQQALMEALNKSSGGLGAWAVTGIVVAIAGITALSLYLIKKHKI